VPKIHEWVSVKMADKGVKALMDQPVTLYGTLHVGEMRENGYLTGIYRLDGERMKVADEEAFEFAICDLWTAVALYPVSNLFTERRQKAPAAIAPRRSAVVDHLYAFVPRHPKAPEGYRRNAQIANRKSQIANLKSPSKWQASVALAAYLDPQAKRFWRVAK